MRKNNILFLILSLTALTSCELSQQLSSEEESIVPSSSIEESSSTTSISEEEDSISESIIESSTSEISSEPSEDISSSSESSSTSDSGTSYENKKEYYYKITSSNYTSVTNITFSDVSINSKYSDELSIAPSGFISANGFDYISKISILVFGSYDNLVVYKGESTSDSKVTATSEKTTSGTKTTCNYTYTFDGGNAFYISNPSTYTIDAYNITIYFKGNTTVTLPDGKEDSETDAKETGWTNQDYNDYYENTNINLSGQELLTSLQDLNKLKRKSTVGYKNMWNYYKQTDYDPDNPSNYLAYYRGTSASKSSMNKEHIWPNSRGGNLVEDDIHMPRPTLSSDNSSRGNSFYVEGSNSTSSGWDPKTAKMTERYRGDAARIIFYCCVASNQLSLVDTDNDATSNYTMGKLSDLLKWNLEYPVNQSEINRNNGAENIQGNRNPFIDNTSFACAIWGNTNATTKKICSSTSVKEEEITKQEDSEEIKEEEKEIVGNFEIIASASDLEIGKKYVLGCKTSKVVAGAFNTKYLSSVAATYTDNIASITSEALIFTLGGEEGAYTLSCSNGLLGATSNKNLTFDAGVTTWNITFNDTYVTIASTNTKYGSIQYNSDAPRFLNYTSTLNAINLLKEVEE